MVERAAGEAARDGLGALGISAVARSLEKGEVQTLLLSPNPPPAIELRARWVSASTAATFSWAIRSSAISAVTSCISSRVPRRRSFARPSPLKLKSASGTRRSSSGQGTLLPSCASAPIAKRRSRWRTDRRALQHVSAIDTQSAVSGSILSSSTIPAVPGSQVNVSGCVTNVT